MSFLDKFLNVMRLNPDDDDDFYNEDYDYDDDEEEVKPKSSFKKREKEDTFTDDYKEKPVRTTPKVTPIRPSKKQQNLACLDKSINFFLQSSCSFIMSFSTVLWLYQKSLQYSENHLKYQPLPE
jgi:FtsZ-interacting cell division protein YlmF